MTSQSQARFKHLQDFPINTFPTQIIAGDYTSGNTIEDLHSKINTKHLMYASNACHSIRNSYLFFRDKYSSRRERGNIKVLTRKFQNQFSKA